ncbi:MAG: hypothetical protein JSV09_12930 [Thermoplasmata archaeon]|nr:MAG: hypothetical protein JSV09_12930 [Thermoplasmata archaeon]
MLKKLFITNKKVAALFLVIIVCIISFPFFLYTVHYRLSVTAPITNKIAKSGETVEFNITFELEGGNSVKVIEITDIDKVGDWNIGYGGRTIRISPDSIKNVTITVNIPEDAENFKRYSFEFDLRGDYYMENLRFRVTVDNHEPPLTDRYAGSIRGMEGGSDLGLSPFVFIPEAIIIICVILLFIFVRKARSNEKQNQPP